MRQHVFLALEGSDGSGKTSLRMHLFRKAQALREDLLGLVSFCWLDAQHTEMIVGARYLGRKYSPDVMLKALVGDKEALCRRIIVPHLSSRHIICDRYIASDMVQGPTHYGLEPSAVYEAYCRSRIVVPQCTLFIDTPPKLACERMAAKGKGSSRHWWEVLDVQRRLYDRYIDILFGPRFPLLKPVIRIDNSRTMEETIRQVEDVVLPMLDGA